MRKNTKRVVAVAASAALLTGTGVAFAYWTTDGTGEGAASTAAGNDAAFEVTGAVEKAMYPGDAPQTVTATVENTGDENYRVQLLEAFVTTDQAGCDGSDFLLNGTPAPSTEETAADLDISGTDLAPGAEQTRTFTLQFHNKTDLPGVPAIKDDPATASVETQAAVAPVSGDQDACKDAKVTVHYVAS